MTFTCRCGYVSKGGLQFHCACGWHSKVQAARCYGCGARIVLGNPEPVEYTIGPEPVIAGGRRWTAGEEAQLAELAGLGVPSREIARQFGRTQNAISTRRSRMGVA